MPVKVTKTLIVFAKQIHLSNIYLTDVFLCIFRGPFAPKNAFAAQMLTKKSDCICECREFFPHISRALCANLLRKESICEANACEN
jgi:hypothetical protein